MHHETPIRRPVFQSGLPWGEENSNRYTVRIESPVSRTKQRTFSHSNRYTKRVPSAAACSMPRKINRKPKLIERLVSHSKQRAASQINRKLSRTSVSQFSLSPFQFRFLIATASRIEIQPMCMNTKEKTFSNSNKNGVFLVVGSVATQSFHELFGDPDGAHEEVNQPLEEGRLVAFDAMPGEKQDPASNKKREANFPVRERRDHNSRDDDGDAEGVKNFIPGVGVLVIVLRHVLAEGWHRAPPKFSISGKLFRDAQQHNAVRGNLYPMLALQLAEIFAGPYVADVNAPLESEIFEAQDAFGRRLVAIENP